MVDKEGKIHAADAEEFIHALVGLKPPQVFRIAKVLHVNYFEVTPNEENKITSPDQIKFKEGRQLIEELVMAFCTCSRQDRRWLLKTIKKMG